MTYAYLEAFRVANVQLEKSLQSVTSWNHGGKAGQGEVRRAGYSYMWAQIERRALTWRSMRSGACHLISRDLITPKTTRVRTAEVRAHQALYKMTEPHGLMDDLVQIVSRQCVLVPDVFILGYLASVQSSILLWLRAPDFEKWNLLFVWAVPTWVGFLCVGYISRYFCWLDLRFKYCKVCVSVFSTKYCCLCLVVLTVMGLSIFSCWCLFLPSEKALLVVCFRA